MIPEDLQLIEILNKNGVPQQKAVKNKIIKQTNLSLNSEDIFCNFDSVYTERMLRVEKKNAARELLREKQVEVKMKQVIYSNSQKPVNVLGKTRLLIFKSPSGQGVVNQKDNGYKYRFSGSCVGLVKMVMEENGFVEGGEEALLVWNVGVVSSGIYHSLGPYQKINHFPKSFEITRKDLMLQNLSKMKNKHPNTYNFFPATYILPNEMSQFSETEKGGAKWYIIKPNNKSQGKGIWLSNDPLEIISMYKETVVVSEYIYNPLLINGLKFDLRLYVAITCLNPLRIYLYQDGLTRFATTPYTFDLSSKENVFAHLTNYSLNKMADNFEANEDKDECKGHKWSLHALREHLRQEGIDTQTLWARMEDLVIKTILSIENTMFNACEMGVPFRTNCFQLLGFDVLIDQTLRPWLVEVNLSPSLNTDSPLDLKIKGQMLADLFTLVGIVGLDQQFLDTNYLTNTNKRARLNANQYAKLQSTILKQAELEEARSASWNKIYPCYNACNYKKLFDLDRPFNILLRQEETKKAKNKSFKPKC